MAHKPEGRQGRGQWTRNTTPATPKRGVGNQQKLGMWNGVKNLTQQPILWRSLILQRRFLHPHDFYGDFPSHSIRKKKKHDSQCSQALMIIWRFPKIGVPPVLIHFFIGIPWNKPSSVFGVPPWLWKPPYGGFTNTLRIIIVHPISINQWTDISWRVKMPVSCFI